MDLKTVVCNEGQRLRHTFEAQREEVENPDQMPVLSGCSIYFHNSQPKFMEVPSVTPRDQIGQLFLDFMMDAFAKHGSVPELVMYSWEGWLQKKINGVNTVDPSHRQILTVGASEDGDSGLFVTPVIRGELNKGFHDSGYQEDETLLSKMNEVKHVAEDDSYPTIRE